MSLLTICQRAAVAIGLPRPSVIVGNSEPDAMELMEFANQEGEEAARRHNWQALQREQTFTSVATETQTGMVPADLERFINETFWNRTTRRRMIGPIDPQAWQAMKAQTTTPIDNWFRRRGDDILIYPAPTAGQTLAFEYVSTQWCESAGGTGQAAFAADTDVSRLPDRLFVLGVRWRFLRAKGLDYSPAQEEYEAAMQVAILGDVPRRTASLASESLGKAPGVYVPEGDWNL